MLKLYYYLSRRKHQKNDKKNEEVKDDSEDSSKLKRSVSLRATFFRRRHKKDKVKVGLEPTIPESRAEDHHGSASHRHAEKREEKNDQRFPTRPITLLPTKKTFIFPEQGDEETENIDPKRKDGNIFKPDAIREKKERENTVSSKKDGDICKTETIAGNVGQESEEVESINAPRFQRIVRTRKPTPFPYRKMVASSDNSNQQQLDEEALRPTAPSQEVESKRKPDAVRGDISQESEEAIRNSGFHAPQRTLPSPLPRTTRTFSSRKDERGQGNLLPSQKEESITELEAVTEEQAGGSTGIEKRKEEFDKPDTVTDWPQPETSSETKEDEVIRRVSTCINCARATAARLKVRSLGLSYERMNSFPYHWVATCSETKRVILTDKDMSSPEKNSDTEHPGRSKPGSTRGVRGGWKRWKSLLETRTEKSCSRCAGAIPDSSLPVANSLDGKESSARKINVEYDEKNLETVRTPELAPSPREETKMSPPTRRQSTDQEVNSCTQGLPRTPTPLPRGTLRVASPESSLPMNVQDAVDTVVEYVWKKRLADSEGFPRPLAPLPKVKLTLEDTEGFIFTDVQEVVDAVVKYVWRRHFTQFEGDNTLPESDASQRPSEDTKSLSIPVGNQESSCVTRQEESLTKGVKMSHSRTIPVKPPRKPLVTTQKSGTCAQVASSRGHNPFTEYNPFEEQNPLEGHNPFEECDPFKEHGSFQDELCVTPSTPKENVVSPASSDPLATRQRTPLPRRIPSLKRKAPQPPGLQRTMSLPVSSQKRKNLNNRRYANEDCLPKTKTTCSKMNEIPNGSPENRSDQCDSTSRKSGPIPYAGH